MSRKPPGKPSLCRHTKSEHDSYDDRLRGCVVERWRCARCKETVGMGRIKDSDDGEMQVADYIAAAHGLMSSEHAWISDAGVMFATGLDGDWNWDPLRQLAEQLDSNGDIAPGPPRDLIGELCDAVKEAGGVMRLYGKPVNEGELRGHVEAVVDARLDTIAGRLVDAVISADNVKTPDEFEAGRAAEPDCRDEDDAPVIGDLVDSPEAFDIEIAGG